MNDEWYLFDDDDIIHIPKDEINSMISEESYILFYKLRDYS